MFPRSRWIRSRPCWMISSSLISSIIPLMSIKTQLNDLLKDAMKSGDDVRKRTVRMALASIKQVEVDKRVELDDAAVMGILQKEVKNRREFWRKPGRQTVPT